MRTDLTQERLSLWRKPFGNKTARFASVSVTGQRRMKRDHQGVQFYAQSAGDAAPISAMMRAAV